MKTEISRFCAACGETVAPLPHALDSAVEKFALRSDALGCSLAILNDARAHLRSLLDKLRRQQAYLLIFGPLKSGKSTLMNAISGSYVSEVTSLPGYPCLVFVRDNEKAAYSMTRYNGRESSFDDKVVLADAVLEAHHTLAQEIRAAEERGESFDPRTTFPEAIRRIDIQVPVPALAESSTVLVDTPGLYSRMNFGYDVLTREFRDSAACAVFVVKTDNLFLEQVFAEFNQLLGIFSRIFIVVNVDAGKRDLAPDGSLRPSAESEHPERVIEAFTTLSMSGPLREAYEAGRVRIHAVDLLGAASSFLSGNAAESAHRTSFDAFLQDLTEYLNSSDYTREFIRDSIRQSRSLCDEARTVAGGSEIALIVEQQQKRSAKIVEIDARIAAADRLLGADWGAMFHPFHEENKVRTAEAIRSRVGAMREEMRRALSRWYGSAESLASLSLSHWDKTLTDTGRSLFDDILVQIKRAAGTGSAGLQVSAETLADMKTAGFSPAESGAVVQRVMAPTFDPTPFPARIAADMIPVRKTLADWLMFRSIAKVRARLFGDTGVKEIPAPEKVRRFHEPARAALEKHLETVVSDRFPAIPEKFAAGTGLDYATQTAAEITRRLRDLRDLLVRERAELQKPFEVDASVLAAAAELNKRADSIASDIGVLALQESVSFDEHVESAEPAPWMLPELPPLLVG